MKAPGAQSMSIEARLSAHSDWAVSNKPTGLASHDVITSVWHALDNRYI